MSYVSVLIACHFLASRRLNRLISNYRTAVEHAIEEIETYKITPPIAPSDTFLVNNSMDVQN